MYCLGRFSLFDSRFLFIRPGSIVHTSRHMREYACWKGTVTSRSAQLRTRSEKAEGVGQLAWFRAVTAARAMAAVDGTRTWDDPLRESAERSAPRADHVLVG